MLEIFDMPIPNRSTVSEDCGSINPPPEIRAYHCTTRRLGYRGAYVIGNWILACGFTTTCPAQKETTSYSSLTLLHETHRAAVFLLSALVARHLVLPL